MAPLVSQKGFDVVFFDGADGFIRGARFPGSWQHASNVRAGTTHGPSSPRPLIEFYPVSWCLLELALGVLRDRTWVLTLSGCTESAQIRV